jgi:hypothetical protein
MAFFSYAARLDVVLPPDSQTQRRFDLDIGDLTSQAVGLIPAQVVLIDKDKNVISRQSLVVDVQGSTLSVYGVFGLIIAGITVVLIVSLLVSIWRRTLPRNRWSRALRFLPAGVGLGLVLTFTLSATGQLAPSARWWLPMVLIFGGAAFLIGYFLPLGAQSAPPAAPTPGSEESDTTLVQPAAPSG